MTQDQLVATDAARSTEAVTFLLSDVEGSALHWELDESAMEEAIPRHYELLDAAIVLHGGVRPVEQGEGDSVVGVFADPSDAVAAALDAQRAFAAEPWPGGCDLRIRIALHSGPAHVLDSGCYVGRAVIRCARLRAVAHGGQTVLSAATRDLVRLRLPDSTVLRDLGSHHLKDLCEPERIWQMCHPDLSDDFGPLRSANVGQGNAPTRTAAPVALVASQQLSGVRAAYATWRKPTSREGTVASRGPAISIAGPR